MESHSGLPNWINEEIINENIIRVSSNISSLMSTFQNQCTRKLPLLTVIHIHPKAMAKSYIRAIYSIMGANKKRNILSKIDEYVLLVRIDSEADLLALAEKFNPHAVNRSRVLQKGLASITEMVSYRPSLDDSIEPNDIVKVQLVDYLDSAMNLLSHSMLLEFCAGKHIDIEELNYASGLRLYRLKNLTKEGLDILVKSEGIFSVKKMPLVCQD